MDSNQFNRFLKQVQSRLALVMILTVGCTCFSTVQANNTSDDGQTLSNVALNFQFSKSDSNSLKAISEMLVTLNEKYSKYIELEERKKKENSGSIQDDIIIKVYHKSFFQDRDGVAIGFDNIFELKDFKSFKETYLLKDKADTSLVLFVNGKPLPKIRLQFFNESDSSLNFMWDRNDTLTQIIARSYISKFRIRVSGPIVGFGYFDQTNHKWVEIARKKVKTLDILKPFMLVIVLLWLIFLIFFFVRLGRNTNLLKTGTSLDSSYSLSLTQFAFWTVIIFSSYFYLWIVDLQLDPIPPSTLVLLGITAATTATSRTVDLKDTTRNKKVASKRFFKDLLTEGDSGYSVHRSQLVLVTIMFGIFYIIEVVRQQQLPDFNGTLLWTIGISSGTFVGIKSVEGLKAGMSTTRTSDNNQSTTQPSAPSDEQAKTEES